MQEENVDIAAQRKKLGISQLDLAAAAAVSLMTVRNVERGMKVRSKSRRKVLEALAQIQQKDERHG